MNNRRSIKPPITAIPKGEVVATFNEYADALAYVEKLVENEFPVGSIAIVGKNLRTVERIRTKINQWRIALSGAISGSWIGLVWGIVVSDPTVGFSGQTLAQPILVGAGLGMLFNVVRFSLAKNKRSFASQSMVIASEYQVQVPEELVSQANEASSKPAKLD